MIQGPTSVETMTKALGPIWSLAPPGPDNLLQHPAFLELKAHCEWPFQPPGPGPGSPSRRDGAALWGKRYRNGRADASQDAGWPWPIGKSPDRLGQG